MENANSAEFVADCKYPVIDLMPEQVSVEDKGGTMRLGLYPCKVYPGTLTEKAYKEELVYERHRHRYEVNNALREQIVDGGLRIGGTLPNGRLVEIVEIPEDRHPWFLGAQFHPEFKSRPTNPHPLFRDFIAAALREQNKTLKKNPKADCESVCFFVKGVESMLKKIFISAILLIAVLSFVVSLLSGKNNDEKVIAAPADRVAVINIEGTIVSGEPGENIWGETTGASSGRLMREIREAAADSSVKALVLRINSPGGSVTAAEEVGRELKRFKETTDKPIITSMGDSAASAAYWLAAYSDTIYANPSTLTGSIGVYMPYMNTQELFKKSVSILLKSKAVSTRILCPLTDR